MLADSVFAFWIAAYLISNPCFAQMVSEGLASQFSTAAYDDASHSYEPSHRSKGALCFLYPHVPPIYSGCINTHYVQLIPSDNRRLQFDWSFQYGCRLDETPRIRVNNGSKSQNFCIQRRLPCRTPGNGTLRNVGYTRFQSPCWMLTDLSPSRCYIE